MKFMKFSGFLLLAWSLTACSTTQSSAVGQQGSGVAGDYLIVYRESIAAAMSLGWELSRADRVNGVIEATTPGTLFGYPDYVTIQLVDNYSGNIAINVSSVYSADSSPGNNDKNSADFFSALNGRLGRAY
jgi:hypothetical protein